MAGWQQLMNLSVHDLDDVTNGTTYGKVNLSDLTNGRVDIDKVEDGSTHHLLTTAEQTKLSGIATGAEVNEVTGSNIIAKINASAEAIDIDDDVIPSLNASKITAGTFATDRIPALAISKTTGLQGALDAKVPTSRTVNTKALTANVSLTQDDVGDGTTYKQYSATEKTKLSGIAAGAQPDQSGTEIVTLLEALDAGDKLNADGIIDGTTNKVYTSTEKTKLSGIATGAQVNEVTGSNVIAKINASTEELDIDADVIPALNASKITAGTFGDARIPSLAISKTTGLQTALDGKVPTSRTVNTKALTSNVSLTQDDVGDGTTYKQYSATEKTKLSGIATGAQVNEVTGSNIVSKLNASAEGTDLDDDLIPSLNASKITAGSFGVDRIPSLPTSKITSGTFGVSRIAIDGNLNFNGYLLIEFKIEFGVALPETDLFDGRLYRKTDGTVWVYYDNA